MIEENNERDENCAYVFELLTPKICDPNSASTTTTATTTNPVTNNTTNQADKITTKASPVNNKSNLGFFSISLIV